MVGKTTFLALLFPVLLAACATPKLEYDYPAAGKKSEAEVSSAKKPIVDSHEHDDRSAYNWPMKEAPDMLEKYKPGDIVDARNKAGDPAVFAVLSEYSSAGKKRCKKYFINLDLYLACYNPHWYPVRSFEE